MHWHISALISLVVPLSLRSKVLHLLLPRSVNVPTNLWVLSFAKKTASRFLIFGTWQTMLYIWTFQFSTFLDLPGKLELFHLSIVLFFFLILTSIFSFLWDIFYYEINLLKCSHLSTRLEINIIFTPNSQTYLEWISYWCWNTGGSLNTDFSQH